jgi:hypothetical protein
MSTETPETPEPETPRRSIYEAPPEEETSTVEMPIETPAETGPDGPEGVINEELRQEIMERRAAKRESAASKFQRLDTKVSIDDEVARQFAGQRRTRQPKVSEVKLGTRDEIVRQRTAQWSNWIIQDMNPLLLKATQTWCAIPESWLDNQVLQGIDPNTNKVFVFWDPVLRTRLELSDKKAKSLAKAAAEFSVSPFGVAIVTWVETHQFMIAVGTALVISAQYGWMLMQTKAEVAQVKQIVQQQQLAMAQNQATMEGMAPNMPDGNIQPNGNVRYPSFGETTREYDGEQNS